MTLTLHAPNNQSRLQSIDSPKLRRLETVWRLEPSASSF